MYRGDVEPNDVNAAVATMTTKRSIQLVVMSPTRFPFLFSEASFSVSHRLSRNVLFVSRFTKRGWGSWVRPLILFSAGAVESARRGWCTVLVAKSGFDVVRQHPELGSVGARWKGHSFPGIPLSIHGLHGESGVISASG